jgi:hypothetical protein
MDTSGRTARAPLVQMLMIKGVTLTLLAPLALAALRLTACIARAACHQTEGWASG